MLETYGWVLKKKKKKELVFVYLKKKKQFPFCVCPFVLDISVSTLIKNRKKKEIFFSK